MVVTTTTTTTMMIQVPSPTQRSPHSSSGRGGLGPGLVVVSQALPAGFIKGRRAPIRKWPAAARAGKPAIDSEDPAAWAPGTRSPPARMTVTKQGSLLPR